MIRLTRYVGSHLEGGHSGPSPHLEDDGRLSIRRRWMRCAGSSVPFAWSLGWSTAPPRALNELPDLGTEAKTHLIMLIEAKCGWPTLCNRVLCTAKAAGGVRPTGLLFAIVRVQCKLRRIEAKLWEAFYGEGFFWATHAWCRGLRLEQAAWSECAEGQLVATILYDLLRPFDHVAYQKLIDAAVRHVFL